MDRARDVEVVVMRATPSALLLKDLDSQAVEWFPKSLVLEPDVDELDIGWEGTIRLPEWILNQKGWDGHS